MRPETVLVTSYMVQAALAASYGAAFWGFWRLYGQPYLRDWSAAWVLFAVYAAAEMSAWWLAIFSQESAERAYASMAAMALGLNFALFLLNGTLGLSGRARMSPRLLRLLSAVAVVMSIVLVIVTAPGAASRSIRIAVRVVLVSSTIGATAIYAGRAAWRAGRFEEWFGLRTLGVALVAFGLKQAVGGALLWWLSTASEIAPTFTIVDAILVPIVGSAMAVSLLVSERSRARHAAAEAEAAQAALRRSEAQFRSVIEGASDVILTVTPDGVITFVGPSVLRVLGYPPEELLGRNAFDFVHPSDLETNREMLRRLIGGESDLPAAETRLQAAGGGWRLVEILGSLRRDATGKPVVVINARDLSERVELEARLLQAQKLESIGQLAGGVAHDFNNILTAILGHVSMARLCASRDPHLHAELDDIQRSAERAAELTRQLLAFARRQVVEPVMLDLNARVDGMRRLLARLIGEHITLATELAPSIWPVKADAAQLEQAIVNLALNARDAMPGGGRLLLATANVTVSASEAEVHGLLHPGEYVRLVVQDSGGGMDESTRARIFEPFFTTKGLTGGTGLGLAMVHGVVAQSGGGIAVFSTVGEGSRFSMLFPRYTGPVQPRVVMAGPRVITPERSATILLVEDESQVRAVAARVLRGAGYSVIEASDGADGLAKASGFAGRIDLVLSDLVMPHLSGPAMWQRLRLSRGSARIIFMSGFSADTLPDGGALPDGAAFLDKPFTVEALLAKVREELRPD